MLRVRVYQPVVGPMARMRARSERSDDDEECGWEERLIVGVGPLRGVGVLLYRVPYVSDSCFLLCLAFTLYIAFARVVFSDVSCYLSFNCYYTFRL